VSKRNKRPYRAKDRKVNKPLLDAFQKEWPGFKGEELKTQLALIHCMRRSYHKKRVHREDPDAFFMMWQELERDFGRKGFEEVNERVKLFHVFGTGSPLRGVTKQYRLDDEADRIYSKVLHRKLRGQLLKALDALGRVMKSLPNAVMPKDVAGVTAKFWPDEVKAQTVPVNIDALDALGEKIDNLLHQEDMFVMANKKKLEHRKYYIAELIREAHYEITGRGYVAHSYQESKTGRLSAIGISLQNAPRTVRKAALINQWDYDFENCHYAILFQMAKRYGLHCEHIEHYLHHKGYVRNVLANTIKASVPQIKKVLIALIYGAHASSSGKVALFKAIPDRNKLKQLIQIDIFRNLHTDIKQARDVILDSWPTSRGSLINDCNKGIKVTRENDKGAKVPEDKAKRMAHLIQGAEAHMLRTALRCYQSEIVLLLHDGFVSTHRLDRERIKQAVKETTGYDMEMSEERLQHSPDFDIDDA